MVLEQLNAAELKMARVDACIVGNIGRAYAVVAGRHTEQQRITATVLLRGASAPRVKQGDSKHGMETLIAARLGSFVGDGKPLPTGSRMRRNVQVDYALTAAGKERAGFDEEAEAAAKPREELVPGDAVLCRGSPATLEWHDAATGRCGVRFEQDGVSETVPYASRFWQKGHDNTGCARLQRPQPSLLPPPRAKPSFALSVETRQHVSDVFVVTCPTSPHQKDERKRTIAPHVIQASGPTLEPCMTLEHAQQWRVLPPPSTE